MAPDDASPWWYYDAGGLYDMSNVQLTWNSEQSHRYTIDLSVDGETWTTVADHMDGSEALTLTNDDISGLARYVRISLPAGSTEGFWINSTAVSYTHLSEEAMSLEWTAFPFWPNSWMIKR